MVPYECIPEQYRDQNNKWNKLAQFVQDTDISPVSLSPKPGRNPDNDWRQGVEILHRTDMRDFHKWAMAAWVWASGFYDVKYEYE